LPSLAAADGRGGRGISRTIRHHRALQRSRARFTRCGSSTHAGSPSGPVTAIQSWLRSSAMSVASSPSISQPISRAWRKRAANPSRSSRAQRRTVLGAGMSGSRQTSRSSRPAISPPRIRSAMSAL
jgi:hypothetical protein